MMDPLAKLQKALAAAMRSGDPTAELQALAGDPDLPGAWRRFLARVDPVGVELTETLVANLRFSRLRNGDPEFAQRFAEDPEGTSARFEAFRRATPARAWHAVEEAAEFRDSEADS